MKVVASTSILSLLLANDVLAFTPSSIISSSHHRISTSIRAEVLDASVDATPATIVPNEDLLKENTADAKDDEKWQIKVAEKKQEEAMAEVKIENVVEAKITDPKLRVQT